MAEKTYFFVKKIAARVVFVTVMAIWMTAAFPNRKIL